MLEYAVEHVLKQLLEYLLDQRLVWPSGGLQSGEARRRGSAGCGGIALTPSTKLYFIWARHSTGDVVALP